MLLKKSKKNTYIRYNTFCDKSFGSFTVDLPEIFDKKGVKYAIKTVIYKSFGPPDPTHSHLGQFSQIKPFLGGRWGRE